MPEAGCRPLPAAACRAGQGLPLPEQRARGRGAGLYGWRQPCRGRQPAGQLAWAFAQPAPARRSAPGGWRAGRHRARRKEIDAARAESASLTAREQAGPPAWVRVVRAPLSGLVASSNTVAGQVVEPRELVFEIVDPARVDRGQYCRRDPGCSSSRAAPPSVGVPEGAAAVPGARARCAMGCSRCTSGPGREGPGCTAGGHRPAGAGHRRPAAIARKGVVLPAAGASRGESANEPAGGLKLAAERFVPQPVQAAAARRQHRARRPRAWPPISAWWCRGAALLSQFR